MNQMQPKVIDIEHADNIGILHEINRRLLHPMGMSLVTDVIDGKKVITGISDHRDNIAGCVFEHVDVFKAFSVRGILEETLKKRQEKCGFIIQPVTDGKLDYQSDELAVFEMDSLDAINADLEAEEQLIQGGFADMIILDKMDKLLSEAISGYKNHPDGEPTEVLRELKKEFEKLRTDSFS